MTTLLELYLPRTINSITDRLLAEKPSGPVTVWVFEDGEARQQAQNRLRAAGLQVRILAAYKPLIHFFIEEVDLADVAEIDVRYPVHPAAPSPRFMIEAYPLSALVAHRPLRFTAG
ncbi:MAG: peptidase M14, partial [Alphaproteobacteria bacterium]|nr:peptidase M14 [Alphaproteobacteria bacterium]